MVNLTAFLGGGKSDVLVLGDDTGDDIRDEGADDDLVGSNRDMRNLIAANERGDCEEEGDIEVTVVDDALEKGGLAAGLLEDDVDGFLSDDRDGGGGRTTGVAR